jgi:hypothetical protein
VALVSWAPRLPGRRMSVGSVEELGNGGGPVSQIRPLVPLRGPEGAAGRRRVLAAVLLLGLVVEAVHQIVAGGHAPDVPVIDDWLHAGLILAASAFCAWGARHRPRGPSRAAWWCFAAALLLFAVAELTWGALYAEGGDVPDVALQPGAHHRALEQQRQVLGELVGRVEGREGVAQHLLDLDLGLVPRHRLAARVAGGQLAGVVEQPAAAEVLDRLGVLGTPWATPGSRDSLDLQRTTPGG